MTYWSLQVLYYIGCQQVVIIGMDHSFQQSGKLGPNTLAHTRTYARASTHTHTHCVCARVSLRKAWQA